MDDVFYDDEFIFLGASTNADPDDADDSWLTLGDDAEDDDWDDEDYFTDPNYVPDDDDGFVPLTAEDLSSCHEEWEDWI